MFGGPISFHRKSLTPMQYGDLADVPPEGEWLANITGKKPARAYKIDVSELCLPASRNPSSRAP